MAQYQPEIYWNNVAQNIESRNAQNLIAGDDDPYYIYKRKLVLNQLEKLNWKDKIVLEVGPGPGGNLEWLLNHGVAYATGADISAQMIDLATKRLLRFPNVTLVKTNGSTLPFPDKHFGTSLTITVLQHITHENVLNDLVQELCRTTLNEIIIFERIESSIKGHESNLGRPVDYYAQLFGKHQFGLTQVKFLPLQASYYACGSLRKAFAGQQHTEGKKQTSLVYNLQKIILPFTRLLDFIIPSHRDVAMLHFVRKM